MSEAKQTAKLALEALEDKKAMDVRILDITHVSTLADYFMIASGSTVSYTHLTLPTTELV